MNEGRELRFLDPATVHWLHERSLELFGGLRGVRDHAAFESALAAPRNVYAYGGDEYEVAAAYAVHVAESQALLDGNKRTGVACALVFLAGCGISVSRGDDSALYDAMIAIAERRLNRSGLAQLLRREFPR